jgi:hypothetical protein
MENSMDFEALVMNYLTGQSLFLSPQFSISDGGREWNCPNFVVLDFRRHEIQIVGVTIAYNITRLIENLQK